MGPGAATTLAPAIAPPRGSWDEEAARRTERLAGNALLGRCLYVSRLIGARADLVLHGGGNTSAKDERVLWVKASGRNLRDANPGDFTALDLAAARALLDAPGLDDGSTSWRLRWAALDPAAPPPSVETLTHAVLPHRFVLHAHPDALLAATSIPRAARQARRLLPPGFALLPWVRSGLALARGVQASWARHAPRLRGIILLHHGVLTFAEDAESAWDALLECTERAAATLPPVQLAPAPTDERWSGEDVATLARLLSQLAHRPLTLALDGSEEARAFAALPTIDELARRGPLTPCHLPLTRRTAAVVHHPRGIRGALARYAREYRATFRRFAAHRELTMHDAAPRVVIARGAGVFTAGATAADADAAAELWRHTMRAMLAAEALGGYRSLPARELFEMEYGIPRQREAR